MRLVLSIYSSSPLHSPKSFHRLLLLWLSALLFLELVTQSDRDAEVIKADEACDKAAAELETGRKTKGKAAWKKQREAFGRRRAERADAWAEQLSIQVRLKKRDTCYVHDKGTIKVQKVQAVPFLRDACYTIKVQKVQAVPLCGWPRNVCH